MFTGRSTRTEFWVFALFFVVATMAANYFDALDGDRHPIVGSRFGTAELVVSLLLLLPILSVGTRRLHDSGRSGWWMMMLYIPYLGWSIAKDIPTAETLSLGGVLVGFLALTILFLLPGDPSANMFGEAPRS